MCCCVCVCVHVHVCVYVQATIPMLERVSGDPVRRCHHSCTPCHWVEAGETQWHVLLLLLIAAIAVCCTDAGSAQQLQMSCVVCVRVNSCCCERPPMGLCPLFPLPYMQVSCTPPCTGPVINNIFLPVPLASHEIWCVKPYTTLSVYQCVSGGDLSSRQASTSVCSPEASPGAPAGCNGSPRYKGTLHNTTYSPTTSYNLFHQSS
jgi:hypothetical protein